MQYVLAPVEMLDELRDAAFVQKLVNLHRVLALVAECDLEALVQESQFARPLRQGVEVVHRGVHDRAVGFKRDFGATLPSGLSRLRQGSLRHSTSVILLVRMATTPDLQAEPFRQCIHATDADTMQA